MSSSAATRPKRRVRPWWLASIDALTLRGPVPTTLWGQFHRNRNLHLVGVLALATQQACLAKRDFLVRAAVNAVDKLQMVEAQTAALGILLVSMAAAVARLLSRATMFTGGRNVEYELRGAFLAHLHRLGPAFFTKAKTGDVMSRATSDLQQVRLLLGFGILNIVGSVFAFASALYVMVSISGKLTLASLCVFPPLAFVTRLFSTRLFTRNRRNQEAIGKMSERVLASLSGIRVVRSFGMEEREFAEFEEANEEYLEASLSLARLRGSMGPIMGMVGGIGVLVVFWYGGHLLITDPEFDNGDFVGFWLALLRLVWPMLAVGFVAAIVQRGRAGYARLRAIFDTEPDIVDRPDAKTVDVTGALEVRDLKHAYGELKVLRGVSFSVPAGSSLAIVGRTGSGKSTLAALLPRILNTPEGTVFLDGHDVCDLPLRLVRASVGYAQQDAFLFSTTVAFNIGFALDDPDAERARVLGAAEEAQVADDIEKLPEGFETVVGERGVQLSGGQKQRVSLARSLIREPAILVLDDPLSAVDAKTEKRILEAIDRQRERRTVILITHRIAAASRCDNIVVLEGGRIVEEGDHDALAAQDGLYALFAKEQQLESRLAQVGQQLVGGADDD